MERGYESYRGYLAYINDGTLKNHLFGYGFGKSASLGITIKLGEKEFKEIAIFHNGYINILLKTGLVGLIVFLSYFSIFFFRKYSFYKNKTIKIKFIIHNIMGSLILSIILTTFIIAGWLNNGSNTSFILLLGVLLNLSHRQLKN